LILGYTVIPEIFSGINFHQKKNLTYLIFITFIIAKKNYYATTYSITLVRPAATRNTSPSMEKPASISQLLPLPKQEIGIERLHALRVLDNSCQFGHV